MTRVVVVNAKGGQAQGPPLAKRLRRLKPKVTPLVALISEADGPKGHQDRIRLALKKAMPRAEFYQGSATHGAREVAVLVYGRGKTLGFDSVKLSPGHGWAGDEQDRWAAVVRRVYRGHKLAFVSLHAPTDTPAAIQPKLTELVRDLHSRGYAVVLGGDLNRVDGPDSVWRRFAHSHGLTAHASRVMWAMADTRAKMRRSRALPLTRNISDHPTALSVSLRV